MSELSKDQKVYVAGKRDHVHELAWRTGVSTSDVWDDPRNRGLRAQGRTPAILAPGDLIHLPTHLRPMRIVPGTTNSFRAIIPAFRTRLRLVKDDSFTPWASTKLSIRMGTSPPREAATDSSGWVELEVPVTTSWIVIELVDQAVQVDLEVGGLDPITTIDGVRMRLCLLGGYHGRMRGEIDESLKAALRTYQHHRSLDVTGEPDDATRARLQRDVGC